jgi:hypothetical protein
MAATAPLPLLVQRLLAVAVVVVVRPVVMPVRQQVAMAAPAQQRLSQVRHQPAHTSPVPICSLAVVAAQAQQHQAPRRVAVERQEQPAQMARPTKVVAVGQVELV